MKNRLFDTHAHFEGPAAETRAALERAFSVGVAAVGAIGGSPGANAGAETARLLAAESPEAMPRVFKAVGFDRECAALAPPLPDAAGASAIGEIGLDYHFGDGDRAAQRELFSRQLAFAVELGLPVVVHTRDADGDTLGILREIPSRGIIHSFTGSPSFCRALLDLGFYISISGIVTFKSADNVRETALCVPDDRLLVETDSPFLAPVPKRGSANEPAFVEWTARFLAQLRGVAFEELAERTYANATEVFGT